jgi:hypothetical protein
VSIIFSLAVPLLPSGGRQANETNLRELRDHLGHAPTISLGTACFLAAADLIERTGHEDFSLHEAGDIRRIPPDYSYTGNDCFYVIFERQNDLYFYAVDAYGKLTFLGTAQMPLLY